MPATVTRTLFVGVGGQGQLAAAAVKRRLVEAYGEIPPMVRFLVLDSAALDDPDAFAREEFQRISFPGAADWAEEHREALSEWLDYERIPRTAIAYCESGASQIPQMGRLLMLFNMRRVLDQVTGALHDLLSAGVDFDDRWACADSRPQVIFFSSIAGGTGSGALLDLACAMRTVTKANGGYAPQDWSHHAFLVMPEVFAWPPITYYVRCNGYAFLKQLDFLLSERAAIVNGTYGDLFDVTSPDGVEYRMIDPFDTVTLVSSVTQGEGSAVAHDSPKDIAEAVAQALVLVTVGPSEADEAEQDMRRRVRELYAFGGNFALPWAGGKKCWYGSVGIASLRFPRQAFEALAEVVYAGRLITALSAGETSGRDGMRPEDLVGTFLTERSLNELGEQNQIIDAILPVPRLQPAVPDAKSVTKPSDVDRLWTDNAALDRSMGEWAAGADANLAALLEVSEGTLESRLDEILCLYGGQVAGSVVNQLRGYFLDVRREMNEEEDRAGRDSERLQMGLEALKVRLMDLSTTFFVLGRQRAVQRSLADYRVHLVALSRARADEIRCSRASQFCTSMDVILGDVQKALETRTSSLADLETKAAYEVHSASLALERAGGNSSVIGVYPDPGEIRREITLPQPDPADFSAWYREQTNASATMPFWQKSSGEAWEQLLAYARERRVADGLGSVSLGSSMAAKSKEEKSLLLERAHRRSQPLLAVDKRRLSGTERELQPATICYVAAHPDFYAACQEPLLQDCLRSLDVIDVNELRWSDRDNACFFRHWGYVPAYVLAEFPEMRAQYVMHTGDGTRWCLLLDKRWQYVLTDLDPDGSSEDAIWVWALSASDIDYLQRVRRAASSYSFGFETPMPGGGVIVQDVNLGQGLVTARETFLANREWIDQCRQHLEAALAAAVDEKGRKVVVDDLTVYRERLAVSSDDCADEIRKLVLRKDIVALDDLIANMQ